MKFLAIGACALLAVSSCTAAQKTMPHLGTGSISLEAEIQRGDIVIMDAVEGSSKTLSILGGLVQFIDDDKMRILGINVGFTDQYTYFAAKPSFSRDPIGAALGIVFSGPSAEDRAYYKALEQTPDADIVLTKSMDRELSGIPFFYETNEVTFRGKALKVTSDH